MSPLTADAVRNTSYFIAPEGFGWITLHDGAYVDHEPPGPDVTVKLVEPIVFGDLSGEGLGDAAVILVANGGGSGQFYSLNAVLNEDGLPKFAASTGLGDRVKVLSLSIAEGVVALDLMTHGPGDGLCCPSKRATQRYRLMADSLVSV